MASKNRQNTDPVDENGSGSKSKSTKKMTPKEQSARFIETAREMGCDESGAVFEKAFKTILKD